MSCTGYNIQHRRGPHLAARSTGRYQYYFHTGGGAAGSRTAVVSATLWQLWSPRAFDTSDVRGSALVRNPDFVDVVIQSYRHRYGYAPGDPAVAGIEAKLAAQPVIPVPTINLHGDADGVGPASERDGQSGRFTGGYERRMLARVGHNVPQEAPAETVAAIRDLLKGTKP